MDLYNFLIKDIIKIVDKYPKTTLDKGGDWDLVDKNVYLLDKDTAFELGGYPKESVNIIIQSSDKFLEDGITIVSNKDINSIKDEKHLSFGKIVILKTKGVDDDNIYDFTQKALIKDTKSYFKDVMTRASSKHYFINYKVSKKAVKEGFNLVDFAYTIHKEFKELEEVEACSVILLFGDMDAYKELLPLAEKNKEISIALNHIFDGVNMDCKSCDMTEICTEVNQLRAIHKKRAK